MDHGAESQRRRVAITSAMPASSAAVPNGTRLMPPPPVGGSTPDTTWTWKLAVAVLPDGSVAVHVTVVLPDANVEPDGGAQVTVTVPLLSDAEGTVYVTGPLLAPTGRDRKSTR